MAPEIRIFRESASLHRAAAEEFARRAKQAVQAQGRFTVALSGGTTPRGLYAELASDQAHRREVPWEKMHFFWGDERQVPSDHPDSNCRMAHEALLLKVPVPSENIHRIPTENPNVDPVARQYEETLRAFFRLSAGQLPRFDLVLLGLGADGHTASLFPGTRALHEQHRLVVANRVARLDSNRITVTAPVFNNASCVIFLVNGEDKALPLKAVIAGRQEPDELPAALIRPTDGEVVWLVDQAAGRFLNDVELRSGGADRDT
jgi:6-phosphogluconolactonase